MRLHYDAESDMMYIKLKAGVSTESEEVAPFIVIDYDGDNNVIGIGIEIEDASTRMDLSKLEISALPLNDLTVTQQPVPAL